MGRENSVLQVFTDVAPTAATVVHEGEAVIPASPMAKANSRLQVQVIEGRSSVPMTGHHAMKTHSALWSSAALVAAALASTSALAADVAFDFDVAKPEGRIMVALFDSEANYGGEGQPARYAMVEAAAPTTRVTFENLPDGDYAMRAFHDLDGDGKMKTNPFGIPVEPYAFSNNAVGNMGPASWERAKFAASGAVVQTISLK